MKLFTDFSLSLILTSLATTCVLFIILQYNWKRRWLYYYASKFEGPTSWPFIGNVHLLFGSKDIFKNIVKFCETYNTIFKFWLGRDLLIINSRPEDIEILLNTHVERLPQIKYVKNIIGDGILAGTSTTWKPLRKIVSPAFNSHCLKSFIPVLAKYSTQLVENLKKYIDKEIDLSENVFKCTLDTGCETIVGVKSDSLTGQDKFINAVIRSADIIFEKVINISLNPWEIYRSFKRLKSHSSDAFQFVRKLIEIRRTMPVISNKEDNSVHKQVFDHLTEQKEKKHIIIINDDNIETEIITFLIGSGTATGCTIYHTLLILGMYPEIQKQVQEELDSIFEENEKEIGWEDITKMHYLERVIKETLRLLPTVPWTARYIEQNVKINSHIYPKGSTVFIPILYLHRRSDLWDDPLEFNPDRFLPEKNQKRHRCTYIPFSHGPRSCIGLRYALISMKVMLATILRHYAISTVDFKSIHDIKIQFGIILKPESSCKIVLKERKDLYRLNT